MNERRSDGITAEVDKPGGIRSDASISKAMNRKVAGGSAPTDCPDGGKLRSFIKSGTRRAEVIRFALTGGFCTVLQYGMYVVFLHAVGVPAVVCTIISYAISFVANFLLSSFFTFHSNPNAKKGLAFTASHLINMGMQTGMVAIFKGIVGPTLALLPALAICVPLNYFMVRFAFKNKRFA